MGEKMSDRLVLQALLGDDTLWRVHGCKLLQALCEQTTSLTLLEHYHGLSEQSKDSVVLDFEVLKRMEEPMDAQTAASVLGLELESFDKPYKIKYIGRAVVFCETLKVAVRVHFSNTAKSAQTVFLSKSAAIAQEVRAWCVFGAVEILYKGQGVLVSVDNTGDEWFLSPQSDYQVLPSEHSLAVLSLVNEHRSLFWHLDEAIALKVADALEGLDGF